LGKPLLCRLRLHKWRNYGNGVEVFWREYIGHRAWQTHAETVYEGRECKRCGIRLRRRLVTNDDGTLSCVGWETDTQET